MTVNENISNQNSGRILLIGDTRKAFLDAPSVANNMFELCPEISDAYELVSNNNFAAIAIIISDIQTKLNQALKTLRDKSDANIILLAQMYEEPIAIRLTDSIYNDKPLVDDYIICPVQINRLYEFLTGKQAPEDSRQPEKNIESPSRETPLNEPTEDKIRHLEKLATEDDLTGLKNRRYIMEFTKQIIEYAGKENGRVTLLLFDIDDFKKYNDLYGHAAGDEILRQVSQLMLRCCRTHDVVGRIGGDEFAVVFWDDPSILKAVIEQSKKTERRSIDSEHPNEAMLIAKRFASELEKTPVFKSNFGNPDETGLGPNGIGTLTISGGLASFPRNGKTVQELFLLADNALLEAKRSGKNRIYLVGKPQD